MAKGKIILSLGLAVAVGIVFQVIFVFADTQDTPGKAAVAFAKAYFSYDKDVLSDRLCKEIKVVDDIDVIDNYIYSAMTQARARGYNLGCYVKNKLYHVTAQVLDKSYNKARVRLTAERKSPLRTFFSKGDIHHVDVTFDLVKEDGKWKVCGIPAELSEA